MVFKKILFLYFVLLFFVLLAINTFVMEGVPHVPDDTAYLFMAKMFASGKITTRIPIAYEFVDFFPELLDVRHGTWLFQYPFAHPFLLMFGILIGSPQLIPP